MAALRAAGEEPPISWTNVELRLRLAEVTGEDMSKTSRQLQIDDRSEYSILMKEMRKAANKKKVDLQKFVTEQLRLTNVEGFTVARLELAAVERILEVTTPHATDPVGFGRNAAKTYQQTLVSDPQYCQWVKETAKTEMCNPRLSRFAKWLTSLDRDEMIPEKSTSLKTVALTKGYQQRGVSSQSTHKPEEPASPATSSSTAGLESKMETMMKMMTQLQQEVNNMKGEKLPRKKGSARAKGSLNEVEEPTYESRTDPGSDL